MSVCRLLSPLFTAIVVVALPSYAGAQARGATRQIQLAGGGGFLTSGAYFGGPGGVEFGSGGASVGQFQVSMGLRPAFELVLSAAHARPEWRLEGVPLVGSLELPGARLWFADVAARGGLFLGSGSRAAIIFGQAGPALIRYSVSTVVLGRAIQYHATNAALVVGLGALLPLTARFGLEVLAKDYVASFKSIRDFEAFGVQGRRTHTLLVTLSARVGL